MKRCSAPECSGHLVRRLNGATAEPFYGCSRFPACRQTRNLTDREKMIEAGAAELPGFGDDEAGP